MESSRSLSSRSLDVFLRSDSSCSLDVHLRGEVVRRAADALTASEGLLVPLGNERVRPPLIRRLLAGFALGALDALGTLVIGGPGAFGTPAKFALGKG